MRTKQYFRILFRTSIHSWKRGWILAQSIKQLTLEAYCILALTLTKVFHRLLRRLMKFIAFLSELPKNVSCRLRVPFFRFRLLLLQLYLSHFLRFMSNIIVGNGITLPLGRNSNSTNYIKLRERGIICCKSMGAKTMSIIKGSTNMLHLPQIL